MTHYPNPEDDVTVEDALEKSPFRDERILCAEGPARLGRTSLTDTPVPDLHIVVTEEIDPGGTVG